MNITNKINRIKNALKVNVVLLLILSTSVQSESVTYYINDALGSPVAAMNESGALLWRESYNPYGEGRNNPAQNKNDIGFTGHQKDDATGLTYMQARYYDPVIGRFYSNDPKSFSNVHNFNRYAYANNNPYKYIDPDGREAFPAGSCATPECAAGMSYHVQPEMRSWKEIEKGQERLATAAQLATSIFSLPILVKNIVKHGPSLLVEQVDNFMSANATRLNQKLGKKVAQGRLPFEKSKNGIENAKQTVSDTLGNPSSTSDMFVNSNGDNVYDVYSEKTGFTVRIREGGEFDTLIDANTDK